MLTRGWRAHWEPALAERRRERGEFAPRRERERERARKRGEVGRAPERARARESSTEGRGGAWAHLEAGGEEHRTGYTRSQARGGGGEGHRACDAGGRGGAATHAHRARRDGGEMSAVLVPRVALCSSVISTCHDQAPLLTRVE